MSNLFYQLGRSVGYKAIPAIRKSKWVWQSLTGNEAESIRSETEFGSSLAAELRLKSGVRNEGPELELVRGIGDRLAGCVKNKARSFHVDVLLDRTPTAMALPGGFIFVSQGLMEFCQRNPDELAFVTGHEMGHVIRGHALDRTLARIGAEGVSAILSRGLLNPAFREAGLKWLESSHSQEAELDADEFGFRVAVAAGYDGRAALGLFERLETLRGKEELGTYFSSHPTEAVRRAHLEGLLKEMGR